MNENIIQDLVEQIEQLKAQVKRLEVIKPLYTVIGQDAVRDLTADQNNYAPGNYDLVRLNPTANRTINGITSGVKGRVLWLYNNSATFTITFTHQSASSTVGNRIVTPTSGSIILGTRKTAIFSYSLDGTAWLMHFPAA